VRPSTANQQGFTLVEVLVTLTIVGVMLVPLTVGLTSVVSSVSIREELTMLSNAARGKMEEVLAMGFANIPLSAPPGTPSILSDQVTIGGQLVQRNVIVDLADGDLPPDGLADPDFKQITIEMGSFELQSYVSAEP
jgi:prepilin-type N-terminal cleavage/methylation domain-containing protein